MSNILELIKNQSPLRVKKSGWEVYYCPHCEDTSGHLHLNNRINFWHCWKCSESGRVEISSKTMKDIKFNNFDPRNCDEDTIPDFKEVMSHIEFDPVFKGDDRDTSVMVSNMAYDYMKRRGMTDDQLRRCRLSSSTSEFYWGRAILFWCPTKLSPPKYFVARSMIAPGPKYLNPIVHKNFLWTTFDIDRVPKKMAIVEGSIDAERVGNVLPAGGCLGKSLTDGQLNFMDKLRDGGLREIVILLDKPGVRKTLSNGKRMKNELDSTMKIYNQLSPFFSVIPVFMEYADDPGSASLDYIAELVNA